MDKRQFSPACERNKDPILVVLKQHLPDQPHVLEVASGSGEHGHYFCQQLPHIIWQPSDIDPRYQESVVAWQKHQPLDNFLPPLTLNMTDETWFNNVKNTINSMFNANMAHISPWAATEGLFNGAGQVLNPNGKLFLYGPFKIEGQHTAPSNSEFDKSLKARNPQWGIRNLEDITALAKQNGLVIEQKIAMPANNFMLIFRHKSGLI